MPITKKIKADMTTEEKKTREEKETMLIDLVRVKKCLWDQSHVDYRNNLLKKGVWQEIAKECKFDGNFY